MTIRGNALAVAAVLFISATGAVAQDGSGGDSAAGEVTYKKCMVCHGIGPGAANAVGPSHNGLIGRQAGTMPNFAYSPLNKAAGEAGLKWTDENIYDYLADPNAFLKKYLTDHGKADQASGVTKMVFKLP